MEVEVDETEDKILVVAFDALLERMLTELTRCCRWGLSTATKAEEVGSTLAKLIPIIVIANTIHNGKGIIVVRFGANNILNFCSSRRRTINASCRSMFFPMFCFAFFSFQPVL